MTRYVSTVVAALAIALTGCGGDDKVKTSAAPSNAEPVPSTTAPSPTTPSATTPSPGVSGLPQRFVDCMAEQGVEIKDSTDFHAPAAQQAFQACLPFLHGG